MLKLSSTGIWDSRRWPATGSSPNMHSPRWVEVAATTQSAGRSSFLRIWCRVGPARHGFFMRRVCSFMASAHWSCFFSYARRSERSLPSGRSMLPSAWPCVLLGGPSRRRSRLGPRLGSSLWRACLCSGGRCYCSAQTLLAGRFSQAWSRLSRSLRRSRRWDQHWSCPPSYFSPKGHLGPGSVEGFWVPVRDWLWGLSSSSAFVLARGSVFQRRWGHWLPSGSYSPNFAFFASPSGLLNSP